MFATHDRTQALSRRRRIFAWAFYDWANSAYAVAVLTTFFPLFFQQHWASGLSDTERTYHLGMANTLASLFVVLLAPVLGAIADQGGLRRRFLLSFAVLGMAMTGALYAIGEGQWMMAAGVFMLATIGFMGSNVFYDALLAEVASDAEADRVSSLGYALGYLGGGLLFAALVWMAASPSSFGLADREQAVRLSFLIVAIWWALFTIPLILYVREPRAGHTRGLGSITGGFAQLADTFREVRRLRPVFLFLLAYWLYIDGVDTIIRMAVDYGLTLKFDTASILTALLVTQFVGFPAAIVFGRIGERIGARQGILVGLGIYMLVTLWAGFMRSVWEFYLLAVVIGLVQGGVQALSRSLYLRLIPRARAAEFFGFYNMLGKFAVVLGPFMVGWVGRETGSARIGIMTILVFFILGGWLLTRVDAGGRNAQAGNVNVSGKGGDSR